MSALEKLNEYMEINQPVINLHFMKLILEAICEGGISSIDVEGALYEVHADRLETKE